MVDLVPPGLSQYIIHKPRSLAEKSIPLLFYEMYSRHLKRRRIRYAETLPDLVPSRPPVAQTSCPLFATIPAEIRNRIYELSLESEHVASDDSRMLYRRTDYFYRPGYKQPRRIQTALLQTCQQIYNEASLLPPAVNEHTFWFYRSPPHVNHASSPVAYFAKMTPKQQAQVHHLHFFTQQFFLEDRLWSSIWDGIKIGDEGRKLRGECKIAPKKMTITLRHTDWWFWENNDPLGIDPFRPGRTRAAEMGRAVSPDDAQRAWGNQFTSIPTLEELVIEFETIMRKRHQLDAIIERALKWKFPIQPDKGVYLVADANTKCAYTWIGAQEVDLKRRRTAVVRPAHFDGNSGSQSTLDQEAIPAVPMLKPFESQSALRTDGAVLGSQLQAAPDTEEFYVIFLTWRKQLLQR